ncbi:CMP-N-acetylneuraminic acid synthetase [Halalkaliarchaeum desulfuricum]|uniref:CMP-N-acetylneuraminic acid synthetase n=1 Tax=Halalkaliarchaeum desulfuricum TaxID=2055893 RepID=A0A343TN83_9EURY|nr:acylneuraminate cytidylyltransferase family protein [Halalkaliarchaeum desulfuricum]AUX10555.1 CMP-N-acetylneuraminic acid synthetase [Halalkaliarchaeum desulfuricum]
MINTVIPARGGSKAIPKKNVVPFLGRPLISYTIRQSETTDLVDQTYVSTDDDHIAEVSRKAGATIIDRPAELARDTSSTEEALLHALESIPESPEIVVLLQCTSPLRREDDLDEAIRLVKDEGYDSVVSCCEDHSFYWTYEDNTAVPINYDPAERKRRQDLDRRYQENGSIYVMKREILEEEQCRLGGSIGIHEMPKEMSFEIDTPEDYRIVEAIGKNIKFAAKDH